MKLHIFDEIPAGFLDAELKELYALLPGPSLIRIRGRAEPPLFVATLLHGNEPTGLMAIQKILKTYHEEGKTLPRSLSIFVGNVRAAQQGLRHLSDQLDFNRIWNGGTRPEHHLAKRLIETVKERGVFASIDAHNTSGENPHYGCFNKMDPECVHLASLFSRNLIYFTRPKGVLSSALAEFCPSITIESGKPEDPHGLPHVHDFISRCLKLESIPRVMPDARNLEVYHSMVQIHVPKESRIGFSGGEGDYDFCFIDHIDQKNFSEWSENSLLGWRLQPGMRLMVIDERGRDVADEFIRYQGDEMRLKRSVVPSMFSLDEKVVHQDCLGYFMERCELR